MHLLQSKSKPPSLIWIWAVWRVWVHVQRNLVKMSKLKIMWIFLHIVLLQAETFPANMEDSSEQSHWVSPALLSSDPLAGFTSDPGLLPPGDEGEAFFSSQDTDYASLPSFFPNPSHSRVPSTYRHSSGEHQHPLSLSSSSNLRITIWQFLFCPSLLSSTGVHLTWPPQQSPTAGRATQPLPELALQPHGLHLEQQPSHQDPVALTHPNLALHPRCHLHFHHLQRRILVSRQRRQGESPASRGPQSGAPEPTECVGGQQQLPESDSCSREHVHSIIPLPSTHAEPLQLIHEWAAGVQLCCPLLQCWSMDQPFVLS